MGEEVLLDAMVVDTGGGGRVVRRVELVGWAYQEQKKRTRKDSSLISGNQLAESPGSLWMVLNIPGSRER